MSSYDVACIGTGSEDGFENPGPNGFAMNYYHADGYRDLEQCELVGCADLERDRAETFAERFGIDSAGVYTDYHAMIAETEPDVLSISVWPADHADVVIECARKPSVEAIHCEKPMDLTWGGSREMAQVCEEEGVQLTFNHMRRFKPTWVEAREVVEAGTIGELERVAVSPGNIYDGGTHLIDFATQVAGDRPAEWIIGQIDYREESRMFDTHNENQAYALWQYDNGIEGVVSTDVGSSLVSADARFVGEDGVLEMAPEDSDADVRWRSGGGEWSQRTVEEGAWTDPIADAVAHVIECLETGEQPTIGAENALITTEIIFGIWESSRRRGRVDFPLEIEDNPLHEMVESGELDPK